jgi:hypothetical protein
MKKKLRLRRTTIAILSSHALGDVIAGYTGPTDGAVQTVVVDGKVVACQLPIATESCGIGTKAAP